MCYKIYSLCSCYNYVSLHFATVIGQKVSKILWFPVCCGNSLLVLLRLHFILIYVFSDFFFTYFYKVQFFDIQNLEKEKSHLELEIKKLKEDLNTEKASKDRMSENIIRLETSVKQNEVISTTSSTFILSSKVFLILNWYPRCCFECVNYCCNLLFRRIFEMD